MEHHDRDLVNVLRPTQSGQPLPDRVRARMERLFGAQFGDVRVHVGPHADSLGALACTCGVNVFFSTLSYDPDSESGLTLLGHELAHVLQQRAGRAGLPAGGAARVLVDPALEAEATDAGLKVMRGEFVVLPATGSARGPRPRRAVIQCCTAVTPANRAAHGIVITAPLSHPAGAAAAVIAGDTFIGQDKGAPPSASFLLPAGPIRLNSANPAMVTLRLSTNGNMAVEDVDLTLRQPKVFYATPAVVDASNRRLALLGSRFQLAVDPHQTVTVHNHTPHPKVLRRVLPVNTVNHTQDLQMTAAQSCDVLVREVLGPTGPLSLVPRFEQDPGLAVPLSHPLVEYYVAKALMPPPAPPLPDPDSTTAITLGTTMRAITVAYSAAARAAGGAFANRLQQLGVNEHASPEVGEGFVTTGLIVVAAGAGVGQGATPAQVEDHFRLAAGAHRVLAKNETWGSHWGAVVARDGNDVVTLENYARSSEDALANDDQRYYFQMYDTSPASNLTWHHSWSNVAAAAAPPAAAPVTFQPQSPGARLFANPITLRVTVPDVHYETAANRLHGATNLDTLKDAHNQIAGAADADAELRQALKGLRYALAHLAADTSGRSTRINAWNTALTAAIAAARFRENLQALTYVHGRVLAVTRG